MMKTIIEIKKNQSFYDLIFEDAQITVSPDIYFKYHFKVGQMLTKHEVDIILNEQTYLNYYEKCIKKLKKMMTSLEVKHFLQEHQLKQSMIQQIIFNLEQKRYIDDALYAKTYVNTKKYKEGPSLIKEKLIEKGISLHDIEASIKSIDERNILNDLILKKMASFKRKTKSQIIYATKMHFLSKGFTRELIDQIIYETKDDVLVDESKLLETFAEKFIKKLSNTKEGYQLKMALKNKLYQKGFSLDLIEKYLKDQGI